MFIIIGLLFLALYALIVFYIGWSGWTWMKPAVSRRFRLFYTVALVFLACSLFLSRMVEGSAILSVIGSYWLALFSLLIMLLPLVHLTVWLTRLTRLPRHSIQKWSGIATLILLAGLLGYGSFNAYSPTVRSYDIHIDKVGPENGELHIVMASDMHFSYLSGKNHAERMVEEINALEPDIVLFPGDIVDDDIVPYKDKGIGDILSEIEAPLGVFASLGNHDRFKGETEELIGLIEESGVRVLYDETIQIGDWLTLVGRKDYSDTKRAELSSLTEDVDRSRPVIMLEHQPVEFDITKDQGIDLMVSGHTHHGQIAPGHLITDRLFENDWGHLQKGSLHSIVSSGYGFWGPPIRIGSRAEIVSIHVRFSNSESKRN
ncbi:metallophosphoesterase [Paenibacillus harenae]|uniref:MPP superfamily phosphohydrolase n=1 Tax=Paenibacillus harenae TaxID=306543 RepID=A0ABT9U4J2_PAEHA|nr:metallophosphoesterase [Paenibacillus harenae]MDQ0114561.1 putative MPP superfamily phosphohydrolase [Paenibacillus harenae]